MSNRFVSVPAVPTNTDLSQQITVLIENIKENIFVIGNTVLDNLVGLLPVVQDKVLVTMHRRENLHWMDEWFIEINKLAYGVTENIDSNYSDEEKKLFEVNADIINLITLLESKNET